MKSHLGIASLSGVTFLYLALAVVPASASNLCTNHAANGQVDGRAIGVGDLFTVTRNLTAQGFAEPSTIMLLGSGILGLVTVVRRRLIDH